MNDSIKKENSPFELARLQFIKSIQQAVIDLDKGLGDVNEAEKSSAVSISILAFSIDSLINAYLKSTCTPIEEDMLVFLNEITVRSHIINKDKFT